MALVQKYFNIIEPCSYLLTNVHVKMMDIIQASTVASSINLIWSSFCAAINVSWLHWYQTSYIQIQPALYLFVQSPRSVMLNYIIINKSISHSWGWDAPKVGFRHLSVADHCFPRLIPPIWSQEVTGFQSQSSRMSRCD